MRIYISGPITNNPNYIDDFTNAEQYLVTHFGNSEKLTIINPTRISQSITGFPLSYEEYLTIDIQLLKFCTHIYFLKGWHNSYGCQLEYLTALQRNLVMLFEEV